MAIHLLGSPYGISSHSPFIANSPYPSPVDNMATSSSYGPFMAFMDLRLNQEAIAAIYAQMGISVHFPQNHGKWPKLLFLAIWAHNVHLRICALLHILMQSVQKTLSHPLGQFLAQNPKVAKTPKGPRNTFPRSEAITSIFFPSVFPSQDLWM
ncbi:hypothetical protein O181_100014 [Austropuccinia psidii MF-1]|uniref:Uncharacterized protein n=1 Tax=Austropuccinia psidii MF-1 TaxID=1389203 RepID=A0A9Q3PG02_9BASI|nr:hypothetical protein [Austropuccinia psidii MF-1]